MWRKSGYSVHHLIPTGVWWPNIPENKTLIKDNKHIHHHAIFNADSPAMQIMEVLKFNKKVRNPEFAKEIINVLDKYLYNYYNIEVEVWEELGKLLDLEQTLKL